MGLGDERTAAFYKWEVEGRGWRTHSYPVVLEPPFIPFPGHGVARRQFIDDAHRPSIFAKLFGAHKDDGAGAGIVPVAERDPPELFEHEDLLPEIEILVPADEKIEHIASIGWLNSFAQPQGPVAFELLGREGQVAIRMAAPQRDL